MIVTVYRDTEANYKERLHKKIRFIGDRIDQFELKVRKKLSFEESKELNIIAKELWDTSDEIMER